MLLLVVPGAGVLGCLFLFPLWRLVMQSLTSNSGSSWTLGHYASLLIDKDFGLAILNGLGFAISSSLLQLGVGLIVALLLYNAGTGRRAWTALCTLPYVVPTALAVIIWRWLLNESYGYVNHMLHGLGAANEPIVWFGPDRIWLTLLLISTWRFAPFSVFVVLGALRNLRAESLDAARIDHAGVIDRLRLIFLPHLRNALVLILVLRLILMFAKFDVLWVTASGGIMGRQIANIPVYIYRSGILGSDMGRAAAASCVLILLILPLAVVAGGVMDRALRRYVQ